MANKGRNPQNEEISLWARMTKGIKAWHNDTQLPPKADKKSDISEPRPASMPAMDIQMNSILHSPPIQGSNGLDKRTKEKLTKGKMPIEGRIDLHGMTQAEAKHQLTTFIQNAFAARKRCVLVVTGKGSRDIQDSGIVSERQERGILRARLSEWIYEPPLMGKVLSHVHATPRDGGSGAFYIYLKNQNKY